MNEMKEQIKIALLAIIAGTLIIPEAHPLLSPDDEFADYETWDEGNVDNSEKKQPWMLPREYARGALKLGLALEPHLGGNPFNFGLIGSTDSHTALANSGR